MKINWKPIKVLMLAVIVIGLYAFTGRKNKQRKVITTKVEFLGEQNMYITHGMVNKLLIQNYGSLTNVPKEDIVLNKVEQAIAAHEMIKSAQVYLTVNGELTSKIVQRKPIGRVEGVTKFYLDDDGKHMPLSKHYAARVPIITGEITDEGLADVYDILNYINSDHFFKKNVIGIHIARTNEYELKFRMEDFVVNLGDAEGLEKKFNNFKAFYIKAHKDKNLNKYSLVSLAYNNQVVCTKI